MAEIILELASVATRAGATISYGDKVVIDGAEAVPVALAVYGFGGGSAGPSAADPEHQQGSGGGGWSVSVPVGALVTRGGSVRFVPNVVAVLGVSIPLTFVAGFAVSRVLSALR
ncbi:hypothetical protein [Xylanimonas protaetiae]|uniref:Sporulation protein n=1 Tax=Xylanimonas protaetiae TaxID=2509457 RepID=A0A4P6F5X6_9MICO|nr:hypothetical protein [Xylanimonas protaetiae]QAY70173.1 hypothetical protein ET471_09090 [Xylanimonas protaetiae]